MPRFLITDDDDVDHVFLRHVLIAVGDVRHAFSGHEALNACGQALTEAKPFDCVFMDVRMPGLDGMETMRRIEDLHADHQTAPPGFVVAIGPPRSEPPAHGRETPRRAYLPKPFDRRQALAALASLGFAHPPAWEEGEDFW